MPRPHQPDAVSALLSRALILQQAGHMAGGTGRELGCRGAQDRRVSALTGLYGASYRHGDRGRKWCCPVYAR